MIINRLLEYFFIEKELYIADAVHHLKCARSTVVLSIKQLRDKGLIEKVENLMSMNKPHYRITEKGSMIFEKQVHIQ